MRPLATLPMQAAQIKAWGAEGVISGSALVKALGEAPTSVSDCPWEGSACEARDGRKVAPALKRWSGGMHWVCWV